MAALSLRIPVVVNTYILRTGVRFPENKSMTFSKIKEKSHGTLIPAHEYACIGVK